MENELLTNVIGKNIKATLLDGHVEVGVVISINNNWMKIRNKRNQETLINSDCIQFLKIED